MDVVGIWTFRHAVALQRAMRMTNDEFGERLGTSPRNVAKWHSSPDNQQGAEMQRALDTFLEQADDATKARFALIIEAWQEAAPAAESRPSPETDEAFRRLGSDSDIRAALEWLDDHAGWDAGTARRRVSLELASTDLDALRSRGQRRARVDQGQIAQALREFYAEMPDGYGTYGAEVDGNAQVRTSILTTAAWLDLDCPLDSTGDRHTFSSEAPGDGVGTIDAFAAQQAIQRIAATLIVGTRMVNASLYRLLSTDVEKARLACRFGLTSFVHYALTMDLLEGELIDALADGKPVTTKALPIRAAYLPDAAAVLGPGGRMCAGGPLALTAIARPATRRRPADYLLLVQERGGRVLNAAQRLAVIPKSFHEPGASLRDDVHIGSTLEREMEEELFGREDVDSAITPQVHADPMHPSKLSLPMRWITEHHEQVRMECTGFGLNLVSGNYEFASLIVIDDEDFWHQYAGDVTANWEADSLRQYSSADRELLAELIADPAWSNEGLFALLQGLKRLAEIGGDRVNAPEITWEVV